MFFSFQYSDHSARWNLRSWESPYIKAVLWDIVWQVHNGYAGSQWKVSMSLHWKHEDNLWPKAAFKEMNAQSCTYSKRKETWSRWAWTWWRVLGSLHRKLWTAGAATENSAQNSSASGKNVLRVLAIETGSRPRYLGIMESWPERSRMCTTFGVSTGFELK